MLMSTTFVDLNGNVDHMAHSKKSPSIILMEDTNTNSPSFEDTFYEWGLVEALLPLNDSHVWHDAYIIDVEETTKKSTSKEVISKQTSCVCTVVLAIEGEEPSITLSERKNVQKCPINQIRLKLKFDSEADFSDSEMVQVSIESLKPFICWKPGKIKMVKDNFFVVVIGNLENDKPTLPNDLSNFEIVPKERLRPANSYQPLADNPFLRFVLPLSPDLAKFLANDLQWLSNYDLHKDFKKRLQLINVLFDSGKKSFICLAFSVQKFVLKEQILKRVQMLASMHFANLKESYSISSRVNEMKNHGTSNKPNEFIVTLTVISKYIGMAIGKSGNNIQKARKLPGIHSLDLDERNSTFIIKGESKEVCQQAVALIYYTEEKVRYLKGEYGIFFAERQLLEEIVNKSGIVKLELFSDPQDSEHTDLLIIGKPDSIENFKVLVDYQKAELDEINSLKMKNRTLLQEIFNQQRVSSPLASISNFAVPRNFAEAVKSGIKH